MAVPKSPAIDVAYDHLEATIDSTGTAQSLWAQIYAFGDKFATRGASLPLHLRALLKTAVSAHNDLDTKIYRLYLMAEYQEETQRLLCEQLEKSMRIDPTNSDMKALIFANICRRVAHLRARVDLFGDRAAIEKEARSSGLAAEVFDMIENLEYEIVVATEQLDELQPQWNIAHRDFLHRVERGELVEDPFQGWIETDGLQHVGARTHITDISRLASSGDIDGKSCPICLESLTAPKDAIRLKACSHVLHAECLDAWVNCLAEKCNTCVLCRQTLFTRRQREPTGYIEWISNLQDQHSELGQRIETLRADSKQLVEILEKIQPRRVALSLGR